MARRKPASYAPPRGDLGPDTPAQRAGAEVRTIAGDDGRTWRQISRQQPWGEWVADDLIQAHHSEVWQVLAKWWSKARGGSRDETADTIRCGVSDGGAAARADYSIRVSRALGRVDGDPEARRALVLLVLNERPWREAAHLMHGSPLDVEGGAATRARRRIADLLRRGLDLAEGGVRR